MSIPEFLHKQLIINHRTKIIGRLISSMLSQQELILDIGCGDGRIDAHIKKEIPQIKIEGVDIVIRKHAYIKVNIYNGRNLPFEDKTFDTAILIDVLHHTQSPEELLIEAIRVTKNHIIIKDHIRKGFFSTFILKVMDYFGNKGYDARLPYNYLSKIEWDRLFRKLELKIVPYQHNLKLYPFPLNILFDRDLHFLSKLKIINSIQKQAYD